MYKQPIIITGGEYNVPEFDAGAAVIDKLEPHLLKASSLGGIESKYALCAYLRIVNKKSSVSDSCLVDDEIDEIYKKYGNKNRVNLPKLKTAEEKLQFLDKQYFPMCQGNKVCIVNDLAPYITNKAYKPNGPGEKNGWLSNFEIIDYLHQVEELFPSFQFIDAVPRDFNSIPVFNINIKKYMSLYESGKTQFAVIFNLGTAASGGTHWTTLFIDLKIPSIEYVDSGGNGPLPEFADFISKFSERIRKRIKEPKIKINKFSYQRSSSECGVFALHYIISRLSGKTFEEIVPNVPTDRDIEKLRYTIFRNGFLYVDKPDDNVDPILGLIQNNRL